MGCPQTPRLRPLFLPQIQQEYRNCDKKSGRPPFDFGVIPHLLSTQRTMAVDNRLRRSHFVDNSCGFNFNVKQDALLIFEYIFFNLKLEYIPLEEDLNATTKSAIIGNFYTASKKTHPYDEYDTPSLILNIY